jgi:hypothetical protein
MIEESKPIKTRGWPKAKAYGWARPTYKGKPKQGATKVKAKTKTKGSADGGAAQAGDDESVASDSIQDVD